MNCRSALIVLGLAGLAACSSQPPLSPAPAAAAKMPTLVAATMTITSAAEVPANPLTDPSVDALPQAKDIRWGFKLFTNTPEEGAKFVSGKVTCGNCHLNAGQRDHALPVVGIAGVFPEYNKRAGRPITLNDRVIECLLRSENATAKVTTPEAMPNDKSPEVVALAAYLTWLSRDFNSPSGPPWRGKNTIATAAQIPLAKLDPKKGEALFTERCAACHGLDGQGITIGNLRPGPLWGPDSWNDGAGAARVYTLAGIIRYTMPYVTPGSLTDEEAQQIAAFITSKPRPAFPFKDRDYPKDPVPVDAVYYAKR